MTPPRRRAGVLDFLLGVAAGIGGARLLAGRPEASPSRFGMRTGRGTAATPPNRAAVTAGFEPADAVAGDIARIMALFAASAVSAIALMALLLHVWHGEDTRRDAGLTTVQRIVAVPAEPHLQADPVGELGVLRARQQALLHGTVRLDATTARIPIERAMALLVGQKLDRPDTQGDGRAAITPPVAPR